jgi:uncharacterized membrane protein YhhN
MRKLPLILPIIFWVIAAADITAIAANITALHFITKPLLMPALMAMLLVNANKKPGTVIMLAALFFSWAGDVFLLMEYKAPLLFIFGLSSFLITHILYIIYFTSIKNSAPSLLKKQPVFFLLVLLYGGSLVWLLFPTLGDLKIPVLVYAAVICTMLLCSLHIFFKTDKKAAWLFVTGALLFVVSDSALAIDKFYKPFSNAGIIIMLTYCAAQYYIITGFIKQTTYDKG